MKKEPVIVGQIGVILAVIVMFVPDVKDAITAAGGEVAFGGAIATIVSFATALVRNRVTPVD